MATAKRWQFGTIELLCVLVLFVPPAICLSHLYNHQNPTLPFPWVLLEIFLAPVAYVFVLSWIAISRSFDKRNANTLAKSLGIGAVLGGAYFVTGIFPLVVYYETNSNIFTWILEAIHAFALFVSLGALIGLLVSTLVRRTRNREVNPER